MKLLALFLLLLPLMTTCLNQVEPRDCNEVEQDIGLPSQVYDIYPIQFGSPIKVYCNMDTDRGRWTVFLRRQDGELNFFQPWEKYKKGFGEPDGEHWLGLDNLYHLTKDGSYQLRVDLEDFEGNTAYAEYNTFYIDGECDGYALHVSGYNNGGAGDSMKFHNGQNFSTFDMDLDGSLSNCADRYVGGFWYAACYNTNPTGIYQWGPVRDHFSNGIIWSEWKGFDYSVKSLTMMFRPRKEQPTSITP